MERPAIAIDLQTVVLVGSVDLFGVQRISVWGREGIKDRIDGSPQVVHSHLHS